MLSQKGLKLLSTQWTHRRSTKDLALITRSFVVFLGFGSIFISKKGLFHCWVCPGILVGVHYFVNFHMLFSLPFSGIHLLLSFIYASITHSCTIECYHSLPTLKGLPCIANAINTSVWGDKYYLRLPIVLWLIWFYLKLQTYQAIFCLLLDRSIARIFFSSSLFGLEALFVFIS